ncbi:MAG: TetR/AcrR family transcriptional regulator [Desulfobacterales bacterium]|nr:TetR/AcrR family transcriptional regulator [Desulfobacterales bacterium]
MVSERRRQEKKDRIIRAAARVFALKGYAGTLVADIAAEAGIGKGTLYQYFSSKEDLLFAVFYWYMDKIGASTMVGVSTLTQTASDKLTALGNAVLQACVEMAEMYGLVIEFWAASTSSKIEGRFKEVFRQGYGQYRELVAALITEGIERNEFRKDVDPHLLAATLVGTWDALGLQAWFDRDFAPIEANESFMAVFIAGLKSDRCHQSV